MVGQQVVVDLSLIHIYGARALLPWPGGVPGAVGGVVNANELAGVLSWKMCIRDRANGRARPLHIDKALDVINFAQVEPALSPPRLVDERDGVRRLLLCRNRYFTVERVEFAPGTAYELSLIHI